MCLEMVPTCEHALDWLLGQVLGVLELLDSHGLRPGNIPVNNRGANVAGAIALYPAMLCENKALHPLSKVLNPAEYYSHLSHKLEQCSFAQTQPHR